MIWRKVRILNEPFEVDRQTEVIRKQIISTIPLRENCDTCVHGEYYTYTEMYCLKIKRIVADHYWCDEYVRVPIGVPSTKEKSK
jgi:hypothetical protein